jgi:hypothetical protein
MRRWFVVFLIALIGCGANPTHVASVASSEPTSRPSATAKASGSQQASPSRSASPSPSQQSQASSSPLFAVLEAKGTTYPYFNTVAIAGLDGYAKAKSSFTPMPQPYVGCAGPIVPDPAHVAAGKLFFADGAGIVRSFAPGGQPVQVASFPLTSSQQMLSFAVSPDGHHLLGTIFTAPPKPAATTDICSGTSWPGTFTIDVYTAESGGISHLLYHQDLGSYAQVAPFISFIGWDALGPLATYPTSWATQGGGPAHYYGIPVRVDAATGKVVKPVSDQACTVWDIAETGDFACVDKAGSVSVRRPDGTEIWSVQAAPNNGFTLVLLSPDETRVVEDNGQVVGRDGSFVQLPDNFKDEIGGWLDNSTLISWGAIANLAYVGLNAPGTSVDIGFKGIFVGTVQP